MSEETPNPKLVTLMLGAVALLVQLFAGTQWSSSPKEKIAAGRLKSRLDDLLLSQPDPCFLPREDPGFLRVNYNTNKAMREWQRKSATLELSDLEKQACTSCVKFNVNEKGGADEYLANLQEVFGLTE